MTNQRNISQKLLMGGILALCAALLIVAGTSHTSNVPTSPLSFGSSLAKGVLETPTSSSAPAVATSSIGGRRAILAGAAPDQVAQYVVKSEAVSFLGSQGSTQVLLARSVTRDELPQLGLGCLPDNPTSEEPPYVLVILKGDFGHGGVFGAGPYKYAALVVDVWAAAPTVILPSGNGGDFRQVLNDPTLPIVESQRPVNCPRYVPGKVPYGATMEGTVFPTIPPPSEATLTAEATQVVPAPVGTSLAPPPVGTGEPTLIPTQNP